MNTTNLKTLSVALLLLAGCFGISACSDTASLDNIDEPPFVEPVTHPLIRDNRLVEYNPVSNQSSVILDIDLSGSLVVFIDNDSVAVEEDFLERTVTFHNPLPDYMAFTESNDLFLFQMDTRYLHRIYRFDDASNPNGREQICNLRVNTIFDTSTLGGDFPTLKEQFSVYVETAPISGDCSVVNQLSHYEIEINESADQSSAGSYQVRQRVEVEEDEDATENTNEIQLNTFPVFVGQKKTVAEYIMYSSLPIFQSDADTYGHLGFDRQNNHALTFFLRNSQSLETTLVWTLESTEFALQSQQNASPPSVSQPFSSQFRSPEILRVNDHLILEHGWDVVAIPISAIFDDDFRSVRTAALDNPVFSRINTTDPYTPLEFNLNANDSSIFVVDRDSLFEVASGSFTSERRDLSEANVDEFEVSIASANPIITKRYDDDSSSAVTFSSADIEVTLLSRTSEELEIISNDLVSYFNQFDETLETWNTTLYLSVTAITNPEFDSVAAQHIDEQVYFGHDEGLTIETVLMASDNQVNPNLDRLVTQPRVFTITPTLGDIRGEELVFMADNLRPAPTNRLFSLTDDYGLAELQIESEGSIVAQLFYFDPLNRFAETSLPEVMEAIPEPVDFSVVSNCRQGNAIRGSTSSCFSP